jgi:hypothetical protein
MFPNARLVVVAMLASIVAVSCGLGVFAAFRVNHQPFTRLQSADPPLQLVFGSGAPAPVKDVSAAPFGVRFLLNAPVAVPETVAAVSIQPAPATAPDAAVPATEPEPAAATDPPPSATMETPAPVAAVSSDQEVPQQASQQAAKEIEPAAEPATAPDSKSGAADSVALTSPPDQTPTVVSALPDTHAAAADNKTSATPSVKPAAKAAAKSSRKEAERRVVKVRRFRRAQPAPVAQSPMQSFALTPAYQAAPDGTAPQVVRRGLVKRHHPANKAAAQAPAGNQTPATGPALATSTR